MTHYLVIAHTNAYSGNFERQSIAYATGQFGMCGVGSDEARDARQTIDADILAWWDNNAVHVKNNSNCARPASIYPTPGFFNNGYGGNFPCTEQGRIDALAHYKKEKMKYARKDLGALSAVVIGEGNWTEGGLEEHASRLRDELSNLEKHVEVVEYPAYMSVAIKVKERPPSNVMRSFEERMREFLVEECIEVSGFAADAESCKPAPRQLRAKV